MTTVTVTAMKVRVQRFFQRTKRPIYKLLRETTHQQRTQQENCLTNSPTLASNKQKQTRDRKSFSLENPNQPRYNENTLLTQTT